MKKANRETLSLMEACAYIEEMTGHRPHSATLSRWGQRGYLECFFIGRRQFTTRTAVRNLLETFNGKSFPQVSEEPSARRAARKAKGVKP